jgi:uncharacterized MAPEG superfamily protein
MNLTPNQILLISIAAAAALIYVPAFVMAFSRFQIRIDLSAPRATWAHQNSFEVFMIYAAAALMVYVSGQASATTTSLAVTFLACRLAYSLFYITDVPIARSLMWGGSMTCIGSLMLTSFGL